MIMPRVGSSGLTKHKSQYSLEILTALRWNSQSSSFAKCGSRVKVQNVHARYLVTRMVGTARQIMHLG